MLSVVRQTNHSSTSFAASVSSRSRSASMPLLIKDRVVVDDAWVVVRDAAQLDAAPAGSDVIVSLALWTDLRTSLTSPARIGVWLAPSDDPEKLAADLSRLTVIAVDFPQFS